jgi:magnesium-transporting ATPase (P-type)
MFVADKLILHQYWFYADGHDRDLDNWYRLAGIVSLSGYLLWSLRYYSIYKKLAGQVLSVADSVLFRWIKTYLVALLFMQVCDIVFFCFFPAWGSFTSKWWYYFMFSVLFYYVALECVCQFNPPFVYVSPYRKRVLLFGYPAAINSPSFFAGTL